MKAKEKLIIGSFLILFVAIGAFGVVWNKVLEWDQCDQLEIKITHLGNRTDDLLFSYGLYREITKNPNRLAAFRKYIELKEPLAKTMIERYAKQCRAGYQKQILLIMLQNHALYLRTKGLLFEESQAAKMHWLRGVSPHKDSLLLD